MTCKCDKNANGNYLIDKKEVERVIKENIEEQEEIRNYEITKIKYKENQLRATAKVSVVYANDKTDNIEIELSKAVDESGNEATKDRFITVFKCDTVILGKDITSGEVVCQDPDKNPRYVGVDPNNYVQFNGELWRIIGLFDGQPKIVSTKYYGNDNYFEIVWDYNYTNNWEVSTLGVELNNKIDDIYNKTVLIIGLGGVGSYAVEALVRSGISNLIIVDNDTISLSNLYI